jgi:hypothetical protein
MWVILEIALYLVYKLTVFNTALSGYPDYLAK